MLTKSSCKLIIDFQIPAYENAYLKIAFITDIVSTSNSLLSKETLSVRLFFSEEIKLELEKEKKLKILKILLNWD